MPPSIGPERPRPQKRESFSFFTLPVIIHEAIRKFSAGRLNALPPLPTSADAFEKLSLQDQNIYLIYVLSEQRFVLVEEMYDLLNEINTADQVATFVVYLTTPVKELLAQLLHTKTQRHTFLKTLTEYPQLLPFLAEHLDLNSNASLSLPITEEESLTYKELLLALRMIADEAFSRWLLPNVTATPFSQLLTLIIERLRHWDKCLTIFELLLIHPNRYDFISQVTPDQLFKVLDSESCNVRPDLVDRENTAKFLFYEPLFTLEVWQFLRLPQNQQEPQHWSARITHSLNFIRSLDLHGVTQDQMDRTLFQKWQPKTPSEREQKDDFSSLPPNEQQLLIRKLNNIPTPKEQALRTQVRRKNAQRLGVSQDELLLTPEQELKLSQVDFLEHKYHPLHSLLVTYGDEIETNLPNYVIGPKKLRDVPRIDRVVYHFLETAGFALGRDGLELAPGPFWHPETKILIFDIWRNARLLDLNNYYMPSLHSNVGTKAADNLAILVTLLQGTGYAYIPKFSSSKKADDISYLTIQGKTRNGEDYHDCKAFRVLSPEGYRAHTRAMCYLAASIKAFELGFPPPDLEQIEVLKNPVLRRQLMYSHDVTPATIRKNSHLTPEQQSLAVVWLNTLRDFEYLLAHFQLTEVPRTSRPMTKAKVFSKKIEAVFPDYWHSFNDPYNYVDPEMVGISLYDQTFPNLVLCCRAIVERAQAEVEEILRQAENKVIELLLNMALIKQSAPETYLQNFEYHHYKDQLFERFYFHLHIQPGEHDLILKHLCKEYSIPWQ